MLQYPNRTKLLRSRHNTPSETVLASDRISRTVKYASSCPSLRAATSGALWRVFPRCRYATLGCILRTFPFALRNHAGRVVFCIDKHSLVLDLKVGKITTG
jgi:hypothetical protein